MIELTVTRPTAMALAVGAAMASQIQFPPYEEPAYQIQQVQGTYSKVVESLTARQQGGETFAYEIAEIYASLAKRQEPLGIDFEAAIFGDLESLYEA